MDIRKANREDVREIVRLLADDELGSKRERNEDPLPKIYMEAFEEIESQRGNEILLGVDEKEIIGCLQLTIIPGLSSKG